MQAISSAEFQRFLLTGCDSGVYRAAGYQRMHYQPSPERSQAFLRALAGAGAETIHEVISFSNARPEAALFALALASSPAYAPPEIVSLALSALPAMVRKAQDITAFAGFATAFRGWGRSLRTAVADWYLHQDAADLAAQLLRKPSKSLAQHRALLRRAHPKSTDPVQNALFQWIANGGQPGHLASPDSLPAVDGFLRIRGAATEAEAIRCIEDYRLQPPQVPARWKGSARVWEAMFDHLTYRQLLRNLPAMTDCGVLTRGSEFTALAVARLVDRRRIRAAGVLPLRAIEAMRAYRVRTSRPVEVVFDALDEAFHVSLTQVTTIAKRVVVALDGTGSMQGAPTLGMQDVPAALSAAALGLSFANAAGRQCFPVAFHRQARPLERCNAKSRLAETLNEVRATPSRSDAVSVLRYAAENRIAADAFVVITDRIGAGPLAEEFQQYREKTNPSAKLIVIALAGTVKSVSCEHESMMVFDGMNTHHAWTAMSAFLQTSPV